MCDFSFSVTVFVITWNVFSCEAPRSCELSFHPVFLYTQLSATFKEEVCKFYSFLKQLLRVIVMVRWLVMRRIEAICLPSVPWLKTYLATIIASSALASGQLHRKMAAFVLTQVYAKHSGRCLIQIYFGFIWRNNRLPTLMLLFMLLSLSGLLLVQALSSHVEPRRSTVTLSWVGATRTWVKI